MLIAVRIGSYRPKARIAAGWMIIASQHDQGIPASPILSAYVPAIPKNQGGDLAR